MKIVICLRNLDTEEAGIIVEARREFDFDAPGSTNLTDHDTEQGAFEDFVQHARAALPVKEQNVDVYIGWWGNQTTFVIPQEFFQLIAETGWPISFDIND